MNCTSLRKETERQISQSQQERPNLNVLLTVQFPCWCKHDKGSPVNFTKFTKLKVLVLVLYVHYLIGIVGKLIYKNKPYRIHSESEKVHYILINKSKLKMKSDDTVV